VEICAAIANRRLITFYYEGLPRIVAPAAHGQLRRTGAHALRGYQVGGATKSSVRQLWRVFLVDKMGQVTLADEFFEPPAGYKPGDRDFAFIHCQL
jgi:hypothetical protein